MLSLFSNSQLASTEDFEEFLELEKKSRVSAYALMIYSSVRQEEDETNRLVHLAFYELPPKKDLPDYYEIINKVWAHFLHSIQAYSIGLFSPLT